MELQTFNITSFLKNYTTLIIDPTNNNFSFVKRLINLKLNNEKIIVFSNLHLDFYKSLPNVTIYKKYDLQIIERILETYYKNKKEISIIFDNILTNQNDSMLRELLKIPKITTLIISNKEIKQEINYVFLFSGCSSESRKLIWKYHANDFHSFETFENTYLKLPINQCLVFSHISNEDFYERVFFAT